MSSLHPANLAIVRAHVEAETAHRMDETLATLTTDCVFEDMPSGQVYHGHEGVRAYYAAWWAAFGNVPTGSKRYIPAEDCMIVETRFAGTHRGAWEGVAASGRPIDLPVAIFISFKDGLMSGERFYYDHATLMRQIGAA